MKKPQSAADIVATHFRQIHLDFHTSPLIPDVGRDFDAEEFAKTLHAANVNWVTLFAKCHHGMSYYPTKVGVVHPSLKFDLLGAQIEACKRHGIVTPVYISVRVDQHMAEAHQEWVGRLKDGTLWGPSALQSHWYNLCTNHGEYIDYLEAQTVEVLENYEADGIFFDMCYPPPGGCCFCAECIRLMRERGIDIADDDAHRKMEYELTRAYTRRLARTIRKLKKNATIYYNGRVSLDIRREMDVFTHLEAETLPIWGYFLFPYRVRMIRQMAPATQGMTARFHRSWADFGGIKQREQLEYEAATIIGNGAVMNIGDQLHPRGVLDKAAYKVIGEVYGQVKAKEPWCLRAKAVTDIAVLVLPDKPGAPMWNETESDSGAGRMLMGLKHQWNIEVPDSDLRGYKVLIIPDRGIVEEKLRAKLDRHLDAGGGIIFSDEATLDAGTGEFSCPGSPVKYAGKCEYTPSYMKLGNVLGKGLPDTMLVMYEKGSYVTPARGSTTMGSVVSSYFNRDYRHFCSHFQTPYDKMLKYPVAVKKGSVVYLYASLFKAFYSSNYFVYKGLLANVLDLLLPRPLVRAECPAAMEVSLMRQAKENRYIVHLINFQPQRQTGDMQYIENVWPSKDIVVKVRLDARPRRVCLAPQGRQLSFSEDNGYIRIVVPEVQSHQMVALEM